VTSEMHAGMLKKRDEKKDHDGERVVGGGWIDR
jgi:hypothetical protein